MNFEDPNFNNKNEGGNKEENETEKLKEENEKETPEEKTELTPAMQELYEEIISEKTDEDEFKENINKINKSEKLEVLSRTIKTIGKMSKKMAFVAFAAFGPALAENNTDKIKQIEKEMLDEAETEWQAYELEQKNTTTKDSINRDEDFKQPEKNIEINETSLESSKQISENKIDKKTLEKIISKNSSFIKSKLKEEFKKDRIKIKSLEIIPVGEIGDEFKIIINGEEYAGGYGSSRDLQRAIDKATFSARIAIKEIGDKNGDIVLKNSQAEKIFYEKSDNGKYNASVLININ